MTKAAILFIILFVIGCAAPGPKRKLAADESAAQFPHEQRLTFPILVGLLKQNRIATIADMLKLLKVNYPDFLNERTALYSSESIQEATFTEPRVIVFGPDAKFVFTFNGGQGHAGGASVEAFQFDDVNKKFNFHEIIFKNDLKSKASMLDSETEFETEQIIVSKANPTKCMDCHGYVNTGPIWDNSFTWLGAYGSNDDLLYGSFKKNSYKNHGAYEYLADLKYPRSQGRWVDLNGSDDKELNGYIQYLIGTSQHPRYRHLPHQIFEDGFRKFAEGMPADKIDDSERIEAEEKRLGIVEPDRINLRFTQLLLELSIESLIHEIEQRPELRKLLKKVITFKLIDYPFFFSSMRNSLFKDWSSELSKRVDPLVFTPIVKKNGSFQKYYNHILKSEFAMQNHIVERAEKDFQSPLIVHPEWPYFTPEEITSTKAAYEKLLGRPLSRTEVIAIGSESGPLPDLALLSYILKYGGIDLTQYDINNHLYKNGRNRVLSFHGTHLVKLYEYLKSIPD